MIDKVIEFVRKSLPSGRTNSGLRVKYNIAAFSYDKKGRVIQKRMNNYNRSHPLQKYFAEKSGCSHSDHKIYLHAEVNALIHSSRQVHKLVIARVDQMGNPALAKPCPICREAIKAYGVSIIEYTTENGSVTEKLNKL